MQTGWIPKYICNRVDSTNGGQKKNTEVLPRSCQVLQFWSSPKPHLLHLTSQPLPEPGLLLGKTP